MPVTESFASCDQPHFEQRTVSGSVSFSVSHAGACAKTLGTDADLRVA